MKRGVAACMALMIACGAHSANIWAADTKPGTIRVGIDSLPLDFGNPYRSAQIPTTFTTAAMFDGLTRIDLSGALKPWLATSWDSTDALTWRFTLRDGVRFSNGVPLTANAVRVAAEYLASAAAVREGLSREIPRIKSARAVDARTVEITLTEPDALFPRSAAALFVAEPGQWQKLGREEFGKQPVGTGPFKLVRWEANRAVLTAHEQSWRRPKMRDLELIAVPEAASREQALMAGRLDVAVGLSPDALNAIEAEGGQGVRTPTAQVWGWAFVLTREGKKTDSPLQDKRVRQAMTMAVNRQLIIDVLLDGQAKVASQGATESVYGYNPDLKPRPFDLAAAKTLMTEAGYPNGFAMTVLSTAGAVGAEAEIHQRIASDVAALGIKAEIRSVPLPQYLQYLSTGTFPSDAFGMTYPTDPNIDAVRPLRIHSCLRRNPFYCDEAIIPKIKAALTARDPDEAIKLRREILAWYVDEAPMLFVYEGVRFIGLGKNVRGFGEAYGLIAYDQIELMN